MFQKIILAILLSFFLQKGFSQEYFKISYETDNKHIFPDSTLISINYYIGNSQKVINSYIEDNLINIPNLQSDSLLIIVDSSYYSQIIRNDFLKKTENTVIKLTKVIGLREVMITTHDTNKKPFVKEYLIRPLATNKPKILSSFLDELPEIDIGSSSQNAYGGQAIIYLLNSNKISRETALAFPLKNISKIEIVANPALYNIVSDGVVINITTKEAATIGSSNSISANFFNSMYGGSVMPYFMNKNTLLTINFNTYRNYSQNNYSKEWDVYNSDLTKRYQNNISKAYVQPLFINMFYQQSIREYLKSSLTLSYNQKKIHRNIDLVTTDYYQNSEKEIIESIIHNNKDNTLNINNETIFSFKNHNIYLNIYHTISNFNLNYDNQYFINKVSNIYNIENENRDKTTGIQLSSSFNYSKDISHLITVGLSNRMITRTNALDESYPKNNFKYYYSESGVNFNKNGFSTFLGAFLSKQENTMSLEKDYNISPKILLTKTFKKIGKFNINVSRSIFIPNQSYLSPFSFEDNINEKKHTNVDFLREYKTSLVLQHSKVLFTNTIKLNYISSLSFNSTRNLLGYSGYELDSSTYNFNSYYKNIGNINVSRAYVSLSKKTDSYGVFRISSQLRKTIYNSFDVEIPSRWSWSLNSTYSINLPKSITIDVSCNYINRTTEPYIIEEQRPEFNLYLYKDFLKGKLNLSLNWDNILNINDKNTLYYQAKEVIYKNVQIIKPQTIGFSLSLLIGKELTKSPRGIMSITSDKIKDR